MTIRVSTGRCFDHWATKLVMKLGSNLEILTTTKFDQIWMAVTAKNASKCKNHWYQPSLQTSIDTLVPVADLISPNLRSSGFPGKPGQEFSPKIAYFWRSKMFLQDCIVGLGYKNTASHVCMIENFKFDHGFCNNFCNNWAKIRQCARPGLYFVLLQKYLPNFLAHADHTNG